MRHEYVNDVLLPDGSTDTITGRVRWKAQQLHEGRRLYGPDGLVSAFNRNDLDVWPGARIEYIPTGAEIYHMKALTGYDLKL